MKSLLLFFALWTTGLSLRAQPVDDPRPRIDALFDRMEAQGVRTGDSLRYTYFFSSGGQVPLQELQWNLLREGYASVRLHREGEGWKLEMERIEAQTRTGMDRRVSDLEQAAHARALVFEGWSMGHPDAGRSLVTESSFAAFLMGRSEGELYRLGHRLYDLELFQRAATVFSACVDQNVYPDTAAYKLGNALINLGRFEEGRGWLERSVQLNPQYTDAWFNLGSLYYERMQFDASIRCYQHAARFRADADLLYGIAAAHYALGRYEASWAHCREALALDSGHAPSLQLQLRIDSKLRRSQKKGQPRKKS